MAYMQKDKELQKATKERLRFWKQERAHQHTYIDLLVRLSVFDFSRQIVRTEEKEITLDRIRKLARNIEQERFDAMPTKPGENKAAWEEEWWTSQLRIRPRVTHRFV